MATERTEKVVFYLTPDEIHAVRIAAASHRSNMSAFSRDAVLRQAEPYREAVLALEDRLQNRLSSSIQPDAIS
jgi:uncharacterized protein (DUF1778 family)